MCCRVWGEEVTATDCGDQVAMWLSQYIFQKDSGARLVHSPYTEVSPRLIKTKAALPWMRKSDGVNDQMRKHNFLHRLEKCGFVILFNIGSVY